MALAGRNVGMQNRSEGVNAIDALFVGHCWVLSNALAQASKFVGIGCIPNVFVLWVALQLDMFKHLALELVKDGQGNWLG